MKSFMKRTLHWWGRERNRRWAAERTKLFLGHHAHVWAVASLVLLASAGVPLAQDGRVGGAYAMAARANTSSGIQAAGGQVKQWRVIASKIGVLGNTDSTGVSDGVATSETSRDSIITTAYAASDLRFGFDNYRVNAGGEAVSSNDITVRASVEIGGVSYPLYVNGRRSFTLEPGASFVLTDPLSVDVPANTTIYHRTYVSVSSGGVWPRGRFGRNNRVGGITAGADDTAGFGVLPNDQGSFIYGPSLVLGRVVGSNIPCTVIVGDSLAAGQNDTGDSNGAVGFIERALTGRVAYTTLTKSGALLSSFNGSHTRSLSRNTEFCTTAILELASNDIFGSHVSLATVSARTITAVNLLKARGLKVYLTTILPRSSGGVQSNPTDSATTAAHNDNIRSNAYGADGYFECADVAETARNSGLWKPAIQPADAIHPNGTGYQTLSACIDITKLQ
jgi:lysophospholipase L1-like esterase